RRRCALVAAASLLAPVRGHGKDSSLYVFRAHGPSFRDRIAPRSCRFSVAASRPFPRPATATKHGGCVRRGQSWLPRCREATIDFLARQLLDDGANRPLVAADVAHARRAVSVELIR